jgi:penicillin-binding protein 1A
MEKVYHDPNSGYTYGPFPKAKVEITRKFNCPTQVQEIDTTAVDSLMVDSLQDNMDEVSVTEELPIKQEAEVLKKEEKKTPENQPVKQNSTPIVPLTKKEERELKRKQRQEEKEKKRNGNNL